MNDLSGQSVGKYHIVEKLGQGGMAIVYKAFDTHLERDVAIKFIRTDLFGSAVIEKMLKRFEREAKTLAKLTHPNIVGIIDYGEYEGVPYLVMEFLPGGTLKQKMGSPIDSSLAAQMLLPVADALSYAHSKNVIHRDVKPANVLMTANGQPMLSDFGVAHLLESDDLSTLTGTGVGIGTPEYMSPEQGLGKKIDGRADVYSLGVILYELITGRKPYSADTPMAVVLKQSTEPLPRPSSIQANIPDHVDQILFKALAKEAEDRYQTMEEFESALTKLTAPSTPVPAAAKQTQPPNLPVLPSKMETGEFATKDENAQMEGGNKSIPPQIPTSSSTSETDEFATKDDASARVQEIPSIMPNLPSMAETGEFATKEDVSSGVQEFSAYTPNAPSTSETGEFATKEDSGTQMEPPTPVAIPAMPKQQPPKVMNVYPPQLKPKKNQTLKWIGITAGIVAGLALIILILINLFGSLFYAPAALSIGSIQYSPIDQKEMMYVPAGSFTMGSDTSYADSRPAHLVTLDAYWIDKTETTNAQYALCFAAGACTAPIRGNVNHYGLSNYENYPVIVDWTQAYNYCNWAGKSLPTEAQWEKAARGDDARIYPWGNTIPDGPKTANYYVSYAINELVAVGRYPTDLSPYGVLDMAGNVKEWTADWYDASYYEVSPAQNPLGPETGSNWVVRGGDFSDEPRLIITTIRGWGAGGSIGFRCVQNAN